MSELDKLRATVGAFCHFIEGLPEAALAEQAWGPKEVLAHLVFYHESYVAQVTALVAGEPCPLPEGRFRDLNAQAVAANRGVPAVELTRRFRAADARLRELYEAHDPTRLVLRVKRGAKPWTLAALIPRVEAHVRNHQHQLEREI